MRGVRIGAVCGLVAVVSVAAVALAKPRNGGFESGDLGGGWKTLGIEGFEGERAPSLWQAYEGSGLRGDVPFYAPPKGQFAALAQYDPRPGLDILHRKLRLRRNAVNRLSFFLAWSKDRDDPFVPRGNLNCTLDDRDNMQFRVDLLKPNAPRTSLKRRHILANLVRAKARTRSRRPYRKESYNLTRMGVDRRKVRLRILACNNVDGQFGVGIDQVKQVTRR